MKKYIVFTLIAVVAVAVILIVQAKQPMEGDMSSATPLTERSIHDFVMKNIDGSDVKMEEYKGKVLLIVNVASECGYTPQYEGLQKIYTKYKDQNFLVLGFPANNFGQQEPGSNEEIKTFCQRRFGVSFPVFSKISVKGSDKHPFYRFLTEKETNPEFSGEIKWNFNKFLVDKNGKIVARFDSGDEPEGDKVTQAIEQAIK
jgi:glutathione peroxidase